MIMIYLYPSHLILYIFHLENLFHPIQNTMLIQAPPTVASVLSPIGDRKPTSEIEYLA